MKTELIIFHKSYEDVEYIGHDMEKDVGKMFHIDFNPLVRLIPKMPKKNGRFVLTVKYIEEW